MFTISIPSMEQDARVPKKRVPKKKVMKKLSHYDRKGRATMVDVSAKASTAREAAATRIRRDEARRARKRSPQILKAIRWRSRG